MCASGLVAQDVPESILKAAYLYNFLKFTEWPVEAGAPDVPLTLCVLGDDAVHAELEQAVKGHKVGEHSLNVIRVSVDGPLRSCHILYVSGLDRRRLMQVIATVKDAPVFTVSDLDTFAAFGGVSQLFVENGKLRFAINPASALRARLRLSSKLLALAKLVKDETDAR
jgi:YfiR/HmsC-like